MSPREPRTVVRPSTLYFEDLAVGDVFLSDSRTVTETDVVQFAGVSGDFNPIHLDVQQSGSGPFGRRLAHGLLGVSMATGFLDSLGLFRGSMIAMLAIESWSFRLPIFIGDSIRLRMTIRGLRMTSDGKRGIVERGLELLNQDGAVVQDGIVTVMVHSRVGLDVQDEGVGA